jgi:hypothetical protein
MRKAALLCSIAFVAGLSVALARSGDAAPKPGLAQALIRTSHVQSQTYRVVVHITKGGQPLSLHIRGQASGKTISVHLKMGDVKMPDGTKVPGPNGAALLLGAFLYERAPSTLAVLGKISWLRLRLDDLSSSSAELKAIHAMTPTPLLRVLGEAHMKQATPGGRLYKGFVAYDNPAVRGSLSRLTGDTEYRNLRVSAYVGRDGMVHRLLLTGKTADGKSTLSLSARLFRFGRPLHVSPPKPGTFMDERLNELGM